MWQTNHHIKSALLLTVTLPTDESCHSKFPETKVRSLLKQQFKRQSYSLYHDREKENKKY